MVSRHDWSEVTLEHDCGVFPAAIASAEIAVLCGLRPPNKSIVDFRLFLRLIPVRTPPLKS